MPEAPSTNPPPTQAPQFSLDELIRSELEGKNIATGRYDEILWKIRAGYVVVLYGALGFFLSRPASVSDGTSDASTGLDGRIVLLIAALSCLCWLMDWSFRYRS